MGIDQSLNSSGLVILDKDSKSIIHAECFSSNKQDDDYKRTWDVAKHICNLALAHNPEVIVIEGLAFSSIGSATRQLSGLQYTIINQLRFVHNFDIQSVPPTTVKRLAGGGKGSKTNVIESLPLDVLNYFKTLGYKKTTGLADLADAYYIAMSYFLSDKNTQYPKN